MTFEEQELGEKSVGVVSRTSSSNGESDESDNRNTTFGYAVSGRRPGNVRESLPPAFHTQNSEMIMSGQRVVSSPGLSESSVAAVGDSRQEMEIKDANGRYRHIRRPPVDEATLQPLRRVSKAGLESSSHSIYDP